MKNIIITAKKVLLKPNEFFEKEIKKIKGWDKPVSYLVFFTFFTTIFITFAHIENTQNYILWLEKTLMIDTPLEPMKITLLSFISTYLFLSILLIIGSFFRYLCTHAIIRIWNKKARFEETYKTLSFSTTPGWLATPFLVIFSLMLYLALKNPRGIIWNIIMITSLLIGLALTIYSIYLRSYSLAKTQKISVWKSFTAIYILGLLLYMILVLIIEVIVIIILYKIIYS